MTLNIVSAIAVKDRLAIACRANHDRPLRSALARQDIGAVKVEPKRIDILQPVALIQPAVDQNHVAGPHLAFADHAQSPWPEPK